MNMDKLAVEIGAPQNDRVLKEKNAHSSEGEEKDYQDQRYMLLMPSRYYLYAT